MSKVDIEAVEVKKPEKVNFILGQSHFIKTVDDVHEALVSSVPGIKFGFAFCEASAPRLIRFSGTDEKMIELAKENLMRIGAGHSFILFLGEGFFPINVLRRLEEVPEIVTIFCATSNPAQILVGKTSEGRGILGVIDGGVPRGFEGDKDKEDRKSFMKHLGYKV